MALAEDHDDDRDGTRDESGGDGTTAAASVHRIHTGIAKGGAAWHPANHLHSRARRAAFGRLVHLQQERQEALCATFTRFGNSVRDTVVAAAQQLLDETPAKASTRLGTALQYRIGPYWAAYLSQSELGKQRSVY